MQRFKLFRNLVLSLAGLVLVSSCGPAATDQDNTIVIGVRSNIGPLDPAVAPGAEQLQILHPVYHNLVRISVDPETGEDHFAPELASRWTVSEDRLSWRFELSEGYQFDDGNAVTSDAIKFTFDRLLAIGRAPSSNLSAILDAVETDGPSQVVFKLKTPVPSLLPLVADRGTFIINPAIMEHEIDGDHASQWLSTHTAGSGAYRLVRYSPRDVYILEANRYARTTPRQIERIVYRVSTDASIRALQMRNGDMDIAYFLPAETLRQFEESEAHDISVIPAPALNYLAFNMQKETFEDRRLREAVALAIDYEAIVENLKYGLADAFDGPLLPGMPGYQEGSYPYRFNRDRAREIISTLKQERDIPSVQMIYPGVSSGSDTMAVFIQSSLAEIGVEVELQRLTVPALIDRIQRGNYDLVFMGWVAAYGDPSNLVNYWFDPEKAGAAGNYARYDNPEVTALLAASLSETDANLRASQLEDIVRLTNEDLAYVYLVKNAVWTVTNTRLSGLSFDHYTLFDQPFELIEIGSEGGS